MSRNSLNRHCIEAVEKAVNMEVTIQLLTQKDRLEMMLHADSHTIRLLAQYILETKYPENAVVV